MTDSIDATILDFLRKNGPQLDGDIASALRLPIAQVRSHVARLSSTRDLVCCSTIQFRDGAAVEGLSCRVSCYTPPPARGRKSGGKPAGDTPFAQEVL
jgi:hypothetical protein